MDRDMRSKMDETMSGKMDMLQGKWLELKGQVRQQWGNLTDGDMARLTGKHEELSGVLQQRYAYTKERAESEINQWLRKHDQQTFSSHLDTEESPALPTYGGMTISTPLMTIVAMLLVGIGLIAGARFLSSRLA